MGFGYVIVTPTSVHPVFLLLRITHYILECKNKTMSWKILLHGCALEYRSIGMELDSYKMESRWPQLEVLKIRKWSFQINTSKYDHIGPFRITDYLNFTSLVNNDLAILILPREPSHEPRILHMGDGKRKAEGNPEGRYLHFRSTPFFAQRTGCLRSFFSFTSTNNTLHTNNQLSDWPRSSDSHWT